MKRRFVVLTQSNEKSHNDKFLEFIKASGLSWWHWLPNSWLLTTRKEAVKASVIRDAVREAFKDSHCLVLELNDGEDTWSGFGPASEKKNMFSWIHDNWKQE